MSEKIRINVLIDKKLFERAARLYILNFGIPKKGWKSDLIEKALKLFIKEYEDVEEKVKRIEKIVRTIM